MTNTTQPTFDPAVKLTRADYDMLARLDVTPRFVSGDFTALVTRGYVEEKWTAFVTAPLYSLTENGARIKRWYHNK